MRRIAVGVENRNEIEKFPLPPFCYTFFIKAGNRSQNWRSIHFYPAKGDFMGDLDRTREQLIHDLMHAREQITYLQRQLEEFQYPDMVYPEMLLKSAPDLILLFDREGVIAEVKLPEVDSLRAALPLESLSGKRCVEVFPVEFTQPFAEAVASARRLTRLQCIHFRMFLPGLGEQEMEAWVKVFPGGSAACSFRLASPAAPVQPAGNLVDVSALYERLHERIKSAETVDELLQTAVQELGEALGARRVSVRFDAGAF